MQKYLYAICFCLIAIYVFGFEYLPLQDYPNWLYQGYIFNRLVFHADSFNGFFHFYHYLAPNSISTVVIGSLTFALPIFLSGKIFLFLTAIVLYYGIVSYLSFFIKKNEIVISALALYSVFNLHFLMGFLNFCFSLGLSLLLMSFLLKKKLSVNIFVLSAILLIIYLSHFIGLALIVLFMLVYCFHYKKYSESLKILPAFLPIMILFIHYLVTKNISNLLPSPITNSFRVLAESKLLSTFSVIIPFNKYKWLSEPSLLLIGADLFFCIFITVAACYSLYEAWNKNKWNINVFLGLLLLPLIVGAPAYFGGMLNPGTRLVLFLELNIFILFLNHNYIIFPRKVILFVVIAFTLGAYSYNIHNAYQFDKQLQGGVIPLDAILRSRSLFEGTDGYLHLSFYHGITHHEALRPFRTGMLDYPPDETGVSSGNKPYK